MSSESMADAEEQALGSLLVRVVDSDQKVEHLRRELSRFMHRTRNVMGGLKMSLYLLKHEAAGMPPPWWEGLERNYQGIQRLLDDLHVICRPLTFTPVHAPFRSLIRDHQARWHEWFRSAGRTLEIIAPLREAAADFDPALMKAGCDALLRWRSENMAQDDVGQLSWRTTNQRLNITWAERPLQPSVSDEGDLDATAEASSFALPHGTLSLPLLSRVARAHQGSLSWTRSPGIQVTFNCPLEQAAVRVAGQS